MLISKSRFLNFIRCDRYPAFEQIYVYGEKAIVTVDSNSIESIYSEETLNKKSYLRSAMFERENSFEDGDDEEKYIDLINPKIESPFDEDFVKIEKIAADVLKRKFNGKVISGDNIWDQKHFKANFEGYQFHCFLDVYVETEKEIFVVEVKASTDRKFLEKGGQNPLFIKHVDDMLYRKPDLGIEYRARRGQNPFENPFSDIGRMSYDLTFQRFVIELSQQQNESLGKPIRYLLALLNHEYVYDGKVDSTNQPIYDDRIISLIEYTEITKELLPDLNQHAHQVVERINNSNISPVSLGEFCLRKKIRQCPYFHICAKDKEIPDKNSIFTYMYNHLGFVFPPNDTQKIKPYEVIEKGYSKLLDLKLENLPNIRQTVQWSSVNNQEEYIDKVNIKRGIEMLRYPLYHLDFETFAAPLPRFKGEKCFTQSVFQYSLHIEREPGVCDINKDHFEFLAENPLIDYRKELYDSLVSQLDNPNGMILAYNVSFEKRVLKELNQIFPEYHNKIEPLIANAFDLIHLLKGNNKLFDENAAPKKVLYYHPDLNGSYSIKSVLPIFVPNLSYANLDVKKGTDAVLVFSKMNNFSKEEYIKNYQALLAYCKLDTWAMVKVLDELRQKIK